MFLLGRASYRDYREGAPFDPMGTFASLTEARAAIQPDAHDEVWQIVAPLTTLALVEVVETHAFGVIHTAPDDLRLGTRDQEAKKEYYTDGPAAATARHWAGLHGNSREEGGRKMVFRSFRHSDIGGVGVNPPPSSS